MKIDVRFVADVHKVKGVEYLDRQTGRNAVSWRLILDYGDDTGEIKCSEQVAKAVIRHNRYEFVATVDPGSKETSFRIVGISENMGIPDEETDEQTNVPFYEQTTLADTGIMKDSGTASTVSQDASHVAADIREKASAGGSVKKGSNK